MSEMRYSDLCMAIHDELRLRASDETTCNIAEQLFGGKFEALESRVRWTKPEHKPCLLCHNNIGPQSPCDSKNGFNRCSNKDCRLYMTLQGRQV